MTAAVLSGIYDTEIGKLPGESYLGLGARALGGALADAGLEWRAVDGLLVTSSLVTPYNRPAVALAEYAGICEQLKFAGGAELGGASPFAAVVEAIMLIDTGMCDVVAVVSVDVPRTGQQRTTSVAQFAAMRDPDYESPFGLSNVAAYALLAQHHMSAFGTTPEDLASVAVVQREYAARNPAALYRSPLSTEEVLASRVVSTPLHLLECRPVADGGAALIVSRRGVADPSTLQVSFRGYGLGFVYDQVNQIGELWRTGAYLSCRRALEMAGIPGDDVLSHVDAAQLYDSYTITLLLQLEALGVVPRGEGGRFVAAGGTTLDGALPVNTHGGLLSHGGPGVCHITEAVRQLRGVAGTQVPDATTVVVSGEGGILSANCTLVLSNE